MNPQEQSNATPTKDGPKRLDLNQFDLHPGPIEVVDGKPYFIRILGADASAVVERDRKNLNRRLSLIRKNRDPGDVEKSEQENIDKLAATTLEWHLPPVDGATLPAPTEQLARKLYADPRFRWLLRKLVRAQDDESGFFSKRSTS